MKNMSLEKVRKIRNILGLSGIAFLLSSGYAFNVLGWRIAGLAGVGIGLALVIGQVVFTLVYYRCRHCGKYLGYSTGDFCPFCGERVE